MIPVHELHSVYSRLSHRLTLLPVRCAQVADIEVSQADHCKLYIHTKLNNISYRIKAETA